MNKGKPAPFENQQTAKYDKANKREMKKYDEVYKHII